MKGSTGTCKLYIVDLYKVVTSEMRLKSLGQINFFWVSHYKNHGSNEKTEVREQARRLRLTMKS